MTLLLREQEINIKISLYNFYIRRIFRIFPVYFLLLALTIAFAYILDIRWSGSGIWKEMKASLPYYFTFTNEFAPIKKELFWAHSWTMGIEWKFYLILPVFCFSFIQVNIFKNLVIRIVVLALFLMLSVIEYIPSFGAENYLSLLMGVSVAILLHNKSTFNFLRYLMTPIASISILIFVIIMQVYVCRPISITNALLYSFSIATFMPTIIGKSPINSLLKSRPFLFIGKRSYSLYLIQKLAWHMVAGMLALTNVSLVAAFLVIIIGLCFSDCLYRWLELPMINIGKRLCVNKSNF